MNFGELAHKKILGVPLMYVALIAVGILAVVAYKMRAVPSTDADASGDAGSNGAAGSGDGTNGGGSVSSDDLAGSVYDGLKTSGTVVVAPSPTTDDTTAATVTNSTWVTNGVSWLIKNNKASGTDALAALNAYLQGLDLTYAQGQLVNAWIDEPTGGPPPDGIDTPGKIASQPAQKQFPAPPGVHTVKGPNDNDYGKILLLYYGSKDQEHYDFIQAANEKLGLAGPWPVGTQVNCPVYHNPKYYVTPKAMSDVQIAAANGITKWQFYVLNNTNKTQFAKGAKVRVA